MRAALPMSGLAACVIHRTSLGLAGDSRQMDGRVLCRQHLDASSPASQKSCPPARHSPGSRVGWEPRWLIRALQVRDPRRRWSRAYISHDRDTLSTLSFLPNLPHESRCFLSISGLAKETTFIIPPTKLPSHNDPAKEIR